MEFAMDFAEALARDVGVEFGGADARMAEHFLDDAQIGAVFEQVRRKGMAKHVRRDVARDAGVANAGFDAAPHRWRGKFGAAIGEEQCAWGYWSDQFRAACV